MVKSDEIAEPNITAVIEEFLKEETTGLSPATQRKYRDIIELLTHSLNGYAYQYLDKADSKKFDKLYKEEKIEFCDIFGPEHILPNLDEFLSYFMVRKVMAGKETLRASGTVKKKLAVWLESKGYVAPGASKTAVAEATKASKLLPKAETCTQALYEFAEDQSFGLTGGVVFDHFTITKVEPGKIWLEGIMSDLKMGPIAVPKAVTNNCEPG